MTLGWLLLLATLGVVEASLRSLTVVQLLSTNCKQTIVTTLTFMLEGRNWAGERRIDTSSLFFAHKISNHRNRDNKNCSVWQDPLMIDLVYHWSYSLSQECFFLRYFHNCFFFFLVMQVTLKYLRGTRLPIFYNVHKQDLK